MLSKRAEKAKGSDILMNYSEKVSRDAYDPELNPKGIVNLGTAANKLCEDEMLQKIRELTKLEDVVGKSTLYYSDMRGLSQFRNTLSGFIKERICPERTIDSEKLTVLDGVTACLYWLATALADDGDVFLCPTPCYSRIQTDMAEMAGVNIYQVPMFEHACQDPFRLRLDALESSLAKAKEEGMTVRGVVLINPHNPTGKVYSKEELNQLLEFCRSTDYGEVLKVVPAFGENLHLLVDEIYALASQGENIFTSILSLDLPDPEKTHWTWGLSKDFGLSGYRCGVIYSFNPVVNEYLKKAAFYSSIPAQTQIFLDRILSDKDWMHDIFFPLFYHRSKETWSSVIEVLDELGIPTAYSGKNVLFLWIDLSKFLKDHTKTAELELFQKFMDAGLLIYPGTAMFCTVPGWFRVNYTTYQKHITEGLSRFKMVLCDAASSNC